MRDYDFRVYLLADAPRGALYVGMTNDLRRRLEERRSGRFAGYTCDRRIHQLVWFEAHRYVDQAIRREKRIKRWPRAWKFNLVETLNPQWRDLSGEIG